MALAGLRTQAKALFLENQLFEPTGPQSFDVVTIHKSSTSSSNLFSTIIAAEDFQPWLKKTLHRRNTLQLVRMNRVRGEILSASLEDFTACFEAFGLESYFLHLIQGVSYGLYHFRELATGRPGSYVDIFYVNTLPYSLLWSYSPNEASTLAILIPRNGNGLWRSSQKTFDKFVSQLDYFQGLIDDPYFLLFVCSVDTLQWIDRFLDNELQELRGVENKTGYSTWTSAQPGRRPPDLEELNEMSKSVGRSLSSLFFVTRHRSIVDRMLNSIRNGLDTNPESASVVSVVPTTSTGGSILEAIVVLQCQLDNAGDLDIYLQNRAKNQISVIFNLLAREDAHASFNVAQAAKQDSSAMKTIAQRAKEDSSAMKTIAVMTMVFLPGTFFAALFSVPSLNWAAPKVITSRFWVYWVFTIPCTAFVFVVWLFIMKRMIIVDLIRGHKR